MMLVFPGTLQTLLLLRCTTVRTVDISRTVRTVDISRTVRTVDISRTVRTVNISRTVRTVDISRTVRTVDIIRIVTLVRHQQKRGTLVNRKLLVCNVNLKTRA